MKHLKPFKIEIPPAIISDLINRLKQTRWTNQAADEGWSYGTNLSYLKELVEYWTNQFQWDKQEELLNQYPQYTTEIDGVKIHFVYVKGKSNNAKPVLLTHGWPDSFYRFYKVIPLLTDHESYAGNKDHSFDVIIPSLPGFAFSEQIALPSEKTADLFLKLMTEVLGYKDFFAAGGDLGTPITIALALKKPEIVNGIFLTDVGYPTGLENQSDFSQAEKEFVEITQRWWFTEGAYNALQSTKPQTIGYALNDSPVGLAAWMIEKFNSWSDNKGNIENSFTKDELLTFITIYWATETINSSIKTYAENMKAMFKSHYSKSGNQKSLVPAAVAEFPSDTVPLPREWAERIVNVQRYKKMPKGGHFAAFEVPELWVGELRKFFSNLS